MKESIQRHTVLYISSVILLALTRIGSIASFTPFRLEAPAKSKTIDHIHVSALQSIEHKRRREGPTFPTYYHTRQDTTIAEKQRFPTVK